MMTEPDAPVFLDVKLLIERSQPRPRATWMWFGGGLLLILLLSGSMSGAATASPLAQAAYSLLMLAIVVGVAVSSWLSVRRTRMEQKGLEAVEELLQLRRWPEAAAILDKMLSRPMRAPHTRLLGLMFVVKTLARYHRYGDVVQLCEYLLSLEVLDADTSTALRIERAMAMLRDDQLFYVDRAIGELRRNVRGVAAAALAIMEMHRDVKTGHPDEALATFSREIPAMKSLLGFRMADAYVLAGTAFDMAGRAEEAAAAIENATLLCAPQELSRRYPESAEVLRKYPWAKIPQEAA